MQGLGERQWNLPKQIFAPSAQKQVRLVSVSRQMCEAKKA